MKISIDIKCTPQEAREFFGLPDISALQSEMLAQMQAKMSEQMAGMNPEEMFKTWMSPNIQGLETLQKMFWTAAGVNQDNDNK